MRLLLHVCPSGVAALLPLAEKCDCDSDALWTHLTVEVFQAHITGGRPQNTLEGLQIPSGLGTYQDSPADFLDYEVLEDVTV